MDPMLIGIGIGALAALVGPLPYIFKQNRRLSTAIVERNAALKSAERARQQWCVINESYETLLQEKNRLQREVNRLEKAAAVALKNDARDPRTGRFVKYQEPLDA